MIVTYVDQNEVPQSIVLDVVTLGHLATECYKLINEFPNEAYKTIFISATNKEKEKISELINAQEFKRVAQPTKDVFIGYNLIFKYTDKYFSSIPKITNNERTV
jgi:hypothetical protein